jgi:hypothetical protein
MKRVFNWPVDQMELESEQGKEMRVTLVVKRTEMPTPNGYGFAAPLM